MGQVEMLTFVVFVLFVNLFLNCIPKISRDTFIWKKNLYIYKWIYYIYFTVNLFICLFFCYTKKWKSTLTATTSVSVLHLKCHLFCLKWLIMIYFLKRCSDSLFFFFDKFLTSTANPHNSITSGDITPEQLILHLVVEIRTSTWLLHVSKNATIIFQGSSL